MAPIPVQYARSGDVHIAFQVVGDGPPDIVFVWGGISHLELSWEHPPTAWFLGRLASLGRLIILDKRGTGLSDRVPFASNLDDRMDDIRAVMAAAGSERAYLLGESEAAGLVTLFAATFPQRVAGLVLYAPLVRVTRTDDFPWAHTAEAFDRYIQTSLRHWGDGTMMGLHSPSTFSDPLERDYWGRAERSSMSPGGFADHMAVIAEMDIRPVLPLVSSPTLVVHRRDDPTVPVGQGRYVAETIPSARLVELEGHDHYPMVGDVEGVLSAVQEFISGVPEVVTDVDRVLATVLFTDIASSTETLVSVGDRRWHELVQRHDDMVTGLVARHRGRLVRLTGDGSVATFDSPARAIRCATGMREEAARLGLHIRFGIHTGEIQVHADDVTGLAVHLASRVQAQAAPGEVLVSRTVVDLVAGSGLEFSDRGEHHLKGIPEPWRLFTVVG